MNRFDLEETLDLKIIDLKPLSGGDISTIYLLETPAERLVLKLNEVRDADLTQSEVHGLKLLGESAVIRVPQIFNYGICGNYSFILMEFIAAGKENKETFRHFGANLAKLHKITQQEFGLEQNNFIGSLSQSNLREVLWERFFWFERIQPQLQLALKKGLLNKTVIPSEHTFLKITAEIFCQLPPALLHGDLWNGNFLIDSDGNAVLIDPSVYFGHPMMDIGMSRLFGGFNPDFYENYFIHSSISGDVESQIELAQLYYLLVHLNLFGQSYRNEVNRILFKFFV